MKSILGRAKAKEVFEGLEFDIKNEDCKMFVLRDLQHNEFLGNELTNIQHIQLLQVADGKIPNCYNMSKEDLREALISDFKTYLANNGHKTSYSNSEAMVICKLAGFQFKGTEINVKPRAQLSFLNDVKEVTEKLYARNDRESNLERKLDNIDKIERLEHMKLLDSKSKFGKFILKSSPEDLAKLMRKNSDKLNLNQISEDSIWNYVDPKILKKLNQAKKIYKTQNENGKASKKIGLLKFTHSFLKGFSKIKGSVFAKEFGSELQTFLNNSSDLTEAKKHPDKWLANDLKITAFKVIAETSAMIIVGLGDGKKMVDNIDPITGKNAKEELSEQACMIFADVIAASLGVQITISDDLRRKMSEMLQVVENEAVKNADEIARKTGGASSDGPILIKASSETGVGKVMSQLKNKEELKFEGSAQLLKELIDSEVKIAKQLASKNKPAHKTR